MGEFRALRFRGASQVEGERRAEKGASPQLGSSPVALPLWNFRSCPSFRKVRRWGQLPTSSKASHRWPESGAHCLSWCLVERGEPPSSTSPDAGPFQCVPRESHFLPLRPQVSRQQRDGGGSGGGEKWRNGASSLPGPWPPRASRSPFAACSPERRRLRFHRLQQRPGAPGHIWGPHPPRPRAQGSREVLGRLPAALCPLGLCVEKFPKALHLRSSGLGRVVSAAQRGTQGAGVIYNSSPGAPGSAPSVVFSWEGEGFFCLLLPQIFPGQ